MHSNDVMRSRLQETIAGLRYWMPSVRHAAEIADQEAQDHWRLAARPHAPAGCPFDFILHGTGRFDLMVGAEVYEDEPIGDFSLIEPLLDAIVRGNVITRSWRTAATGGLHSVETIIAPKGRAVWQRRRADPLLAGIDIAHCIRTDRHYVPYAR